MKRTLVNAYFTNNERTDLETIWIDDESGDEYTQVIEAVGGDAEYEEVLRSMDIDTIHENTFKVIKQRRRDFEDLVKSIAQEEGLLDNQVDSTRAKILEDIISDDAETQDQDELFKFKLSVFELDYVKQSTDRALKGKLRKANTVLGVIECLLLFKQ